MHTVMKSNMITSFGKVHVSFSKNFERLMKLGFLRASYHKSSWESDSEDDQFESRHRRSSHRPSRLRVLPPRKSFEKSFAGETLSKPDWNSINLPPFAKNFYTPSTDILNRPAEDIEEYRNAHSMSLSGNDIPNPIQDFTDHQFPKEIMDFISQKRFTAPTPIQAQCWPIALSGRDLIGIGQTGSGKTLGFIFPGLVHINHQTPPCNREGPIALVVAPTRELVQQIHKVAEDASRHIHTKTAVLYGGASKNFQAQSLRHNPSLCIATPGRLLDFLEMGVTSLSRCTYFVLDEADRMLDMGFEPQIRRIVDQIRPDRQTLMWSATWPKEVKNLARDFLMDPVQVNIGSIDLYANPDIEQEFLVCDYFEKENQLIEKLRKEMSSQSKVLIFTQTKKQVDRLARILYESGIRARGIHGDYSQSARDNALYGFRIGRFSVLVATDVASRGLDVDDISVVINYDLPTNIEDYIHRIGRTARAGKPGRSFSFVTETDAAVVSQIIRVLKQGNVQVDPRLYEVLEDKMAIHKNPRKKVQYFHGSRRWRNTGN